MLRVIKRLTVQEAVVILDLEDALWDVVFPERTPELKNQGRKELVTFARNFPETFSQRQIGIRLNKSSSPEFTYDVSVLAQIAGIVKFDTIVLTKVETSHEVANCITQMDTNHIRYNNIALIIETKTGVDNLDDIINMAKVKNIKYIVYGHYDYSLDTEQWPFLEYDETGFWEQAIPIIRRIEERHLNYIHPPFFQIYDDKKFAENFHRLRTICKRPFGIITLGEQQTRHCLELAKDESIKDYRPLRNSRVYLQEELIQSAQTVKQSFEKNRRSNASFALDSKTGRFISPHVYLAAVRYLEKVQNG